MFICSICNLFGGKSYAAVLRHIGEVHRFDPGLKIRCGINRCPQTYDNFESFRSHVYRKHRETLHPQLLDNNEDTIDDVTNSPIDDEEDYDPLISQYDPPDIRDSGARFLLKTREQYRIPQSTLNNIISDFRGLWMLSIGSVKRKVQECLESNEAAEVGSSSLMNCFDDTFPFESLETEHRQLKYYKEHFNYLVSFLAKPLKVIKRMDCFYAGTK